MSHSVAGAAHDMSRTLLAVLAVLVAMVRFTRRKTSLSRIRVVP